MFGQNAYKKNATKNSGDIIKKTPIRMPQGDIIKKAPREMSYMEFIEEKKALEEHLEPLLKGDTSA